MTDVFRHRKGGLRGMKALKRCLGGQGALPALAVDQGLVASNPSGRVFDALI